MKILALTLLIAATLSLTACRSEEYEEVVTEYAPLPSIPAPPPMAEPPAFAIETPPEPPELPIAFYSGTWHNNTWTHPQINLTFTNPQSWDIMDIGSVNMAALHEETDTVIQIQVLPADDLPPPQEYIQVAAELFESLGQYVNIYTPQIQIGKHYWYSYSTVVEVMDIRVYSRQFATLYGDFFIIITVSYTEESLDISDMLAMFE